MFRRLSALAIATSLTLSNATAHPGHDHTIPGHDHGAMALAAIVGALVVVAAVAAYRATGRGNRD